MVDPGGQVHKSGIVAPDLDRDRALPRRRQYDVEIQPLGDAIRLAKTVQTRGCQHEGIGLAVVQAAEPCVHVAVQRMDDKVRPARQYEADPARTVRADPTPGRQIVQAPFRRVRSDDEDVAWIGSRKKRANPQTWILLGRNILGAVDREINAPCEKRLLDGGDKRPFAPSRIGRPPIPFRLDDHKAARPTRAFKRRGYESGLGESEGAASRADQDLVGIHRPNISRTARSACPSGSCPSRSRGSRSSLAARCRLMPSMTSRDSGSNAGRRRHNSASSA